MDTNLINELGTSEIAQTPEMNNEVQETDVGLLLCLRL